MSGKEYDSLYAFDTLTNAVASFDTKGASRVSNKLRHDADPDRTISRLETLYKEVLNENVDRLHVPATFRRQQNDFLRTWLIKLEPPGPWLAEKNKLAAEYEILDGQMTKEIIQSANLRTRIADKSIVRSARGRFVYQRLAEGWQTWVNLSFTAIQR